MTEIDKKASLFLRESYANSRKVNPHEKIIFVGPLKIEDQKHAELGQILLKDRFAVLCATRILLFKSREQSEKFEEALSVYPLISAEFYPHEAPPLTEFNFASLKAFQTGVDQIENYRTYVRLTFTAQLKVDSPKADLSYSKQTELFSETQKSSLLKSVKRKRDLYFGSKHSLWLTALKYAKKELQDVLSCQERVHSDRDSSILHDQNSKLLDYPEPL